MVVTEINGAARSAAVHSMSDVNESARSPLRSPTIFPCSLFSGDSLAHFPGSDLPFGPQVHFRKIYVGVVTSSTAGAAGDALGVVNIALRMAPRKSPNLLSQRIFWLALRRVAGCAKNNLCDSLNGPCGIVLGTDGRRIFRGRKPSRGAGNSAESESATAM
jgi:hypothetical protein